MNDSMTAATATAELMPPGYAAVVTGAGLFDRSDAANLELTGADAPSFLGNLTTNDIKLLPLGGGCEAYFCDRLAKVQFQAWIAHIRLPDGRHGMWLESTPGRNADLVRYLDRYLISEQVEIVDRTGTFAQFHLAGPTAAAVLDRALGDPQPNLPEFAHMERSLGADVCRIRRHDRLGFPGFDIVCPSEAADRVRLHWIDAGATPGGVDVYETLRVEAGTPAFGPDIDSNRFVMEVGNAARAVSYAKGCYLGQEPIVMARDRAGHVNRAFSGFKGLHGAELTPGAKVLHDGVEVGVLTSAVRSPRLGVWVALGYLKWRHQEVGTRMEAEMGEVRRAIEVVGLPPVRGTGPG